MRDIRDISDPIEIVDVVQDQAYSVVVTFSDGTYAKYVVEELLELRPYRADASPPFDLHRSSKGQMPARKTL